MIGRSDPAIFIYVIVADLEIAAAEFGRNMHQVGKIFRAPAVAHVKVKTAPVVMLDEVAIRRVRTLVRFEYRRGMHAAVKSAYLVSRFAEILRNELVEARQCPGFFTALELLDVPFLDENLDRLLEWTRDADVPRPDHPDFIDNADAFGVTSANR